MPKAPILLTDEIKPPPALIRAGIEALPAIVRAQQCDNCFFAITALEK